jgi:hypothetical protein
VLSKLRMQSQRQRRDSSEGEPLPGRSTYFLLGCGVGAFIWTAFLAIRRPHDWVLAILSLIEMSVCCAVLACYFAERRGKVKSIEELHRPLTLFPRLPGPPSSRDLMKTIPFGA